MAHLETQATKKLSFLNYNLFCLPWVALLFKPTSCPLPAERANHFLKHIKMYDVLALQEVWTPRFRNIERYAKKHGLNVVGSSAPEAIRYLKLRVFGGGLMIISKYPIVATEEIIYDRGTGSDSFVTKGVLYAKIQVGSSFVHVFNTHLQASYGYEWDDKNPYAAIRKKQFQRISQFINQVTKNDTYPIVLTGDFNVNALNAPGDSTADSQEYTNMINTLSGEVFTVVDVLKELNKNAHPITYEGKGVHIGDKKAVGGQRLDFIFEIRRNSAPQTHTAQRFVRGGVVPFCVDDKVFTQLSDHYGTHAVLELYGVRDDSEETIMTPSVTTSPAISRLTSPTVSRAASSPSASHKPASSCKTGSSHLARVSVQLSC